MTLISYRKNTKLTARRVSTLLHLMALVLLIFLGSCDEDDSPAPEQAHLKVNVLSLCFRNATTTNYRSEYRRGRAASTE